MTESRNHEVIALVLREEAGWQLEGIVNFSPNVESFLLKSWSWRWYVVGAYVPPNGAPAVYRVEQALEAEPKVVEIIMLCYLNVQFQEPRDAREEDTATALADCGLVNMTSHFMLQRWYRRGGCWMWRMRQ